VSKGGEGRISSATTAMDRVGVSDRPGGSAGTDGRRRLRPFNRRLSGRTAARQSAKEEEVIEREVHEHGRATKGGREEEADGQRYTRGERRLRASGTKVQGVAVIQIRHTERADSGCRLMRSPGKE